MPPLILNTLYKKIRSKSIDNYEIEVDIEILLFLWYNVSRKKNVSIIERCGYGL